MTRFKITLQQGVDFVLASPRAHVGRRALRAADPVVPHPRRGRGRRARGRASRSSASAPGEKLHEEMITATDALSTVEFDDYFVILPSMPLWDVGAVSRREQRHAGTPLRLGFSYNSGTNERFLTVEELRRADCDANSMPDTVHPVRPAGHRRRRRRGGRRGAARRLADHRPAGRRSSRARSPAYVGADHAVAVSNGTAALHVAMLAAGIGPGDEVIVPALTFAASANCVRYAGGTVVFADVRADTLDVDPAHAASLDRRRARGRSSPSTTPGCRATYDELLDAVPRGTGSLLVEDACHAPGAEYRGRTVGPLAHLSAFSFHPVKHMTTGEGGMVTTNDRGAGRRAAALAQPRHRDGSSASASSEGTWRYDMVELGFNYRLTDVQCALGLSQLKKLAGMARAAARDRRALRGGWPASAGCVCRSNRPTGVTRWHLYPVRVDAVCSGARASGCTASLRAAGIGANVHYLPVYLHSSYQRSGLSAGRCAPWPKLPTTVVVVADVAMG